MSCARGATGPSGGRRRTLPTRRIEADRSGWTDPRGTAPLPTVTVRTRSGRTGTRKWPRVDGKALVGGEREWCRSRELSAISYQQSASVAPAETPRGERARFVGWHRRSSPAAADADGCWLWRNALSICRATTIDAPRRARHRCAQRVPRDTSPLAASPAEAERTMNLDGPIEHIVQHARANELDHRDLGAESSSWSSSRPACSVIKRNPWISAAESAIQFWMVWEIGQPSGRVSRVASLAPASASTRAGQRDPAHAVRDSARPQAGLGQGKATAPRSPNIASAGTWQSTKTQLAVTAFALVRPSPAPRARTRTGVSASTIKHAPRR